jgi:hypothetical protein
LIRTTGTEFSSDKIAITPSFGKVTLVHSENMQAYVEAFQSYSAACVDDVHANFQGWTVHKNTEASDDATCADMQHHCAEPEQALLRLLCPITCGCADPRSGLFYRVESEGCPTDLCLLTPTYHAIADSLECRDMTLAELNAYQHWSDFFTHGLNFNWLSKRSQVQEAFDVMRQHGCDGIPMARQSSMHFDFCSGSEASASRPGIGSLRAFCPVTCRCHLLPMWVRHDCPNSCYHPHDISHLMTNVTQWLSHHHLR